MINLAINHLLHALIDILCTYCTCPRGLHAVKAIHHCERVMTSTYLPPSSPLSTYGPIPLLVLADTLNMYLLPAIRLLIRTFVPSTSLLISSAASLVGLYFTSYPMIIPFLSFSSGGSQDRVAEVLVLLTYKFSGGPLGAIEKIQNF